MANWRGHGLFFGSSGWLKEQYSMIGKILRQRRLELGLTQKHVEVHGGPKIVFISNSENGHYKSMTLETLCSWCKAIGCDPVDVFADYVEEEA